ncbi:HD family phosphohydrolase [Botrimarina hoheduenensis]|uniref:Ribonuclease Y n=1 Tax=Botrimarina hoheduenensis TaxID=2528000 RepID=A0A5C5W9Z8_9BACT|nr:HDIG domain-containing metalloprotein [Botrimarina hoheduenensis]TWT47317.1 Ribonuclease Y [Botrimarina hoheduenensis]
MSSASPTRTRSQRVASVELPRGRFSLLLAELRRGTVLLRLGLAALAVAGIVAMTRGWDPPRDFALRQIPSRDLVATVEFQQLDERATAEARDRARRFAEAVFDNDPMSLRQLKAALMSEVTQLISAESFDTVDQDLWQRYQPPRAEGTPEPTEEQRSQRFARFREALRNEKAQSDFNAAIEAVFAPLEQRGLLESQPIDANSEEILIRPAGTEGFEQVATVRSVLIDNVRSDLGLTLNQRLPELDLSQHIAARLRPDLMPTLKRNSIATRAQQDAREEQVKPVYRTFQAGETLAPAGKPIGEAELALLELGYQQRMVERSWTDRILRALGAAWIHAALTAIGAVGLYRADRETLIQLSRYGLLWGCVLLTLAGVALGYGQAWSVELAPILMFAMTMAIAYRHQSAMLLTAAVVASAAIGVGMSLSEALLMLAPAACGIVLLDAVRHRSTLLIVGFAAGLVAIATKLALGILEGLPLWPTVQMSLIVGLWCLVAGSLMTCVLPVIEKAFRVQTDLSLLELGDPTHPLLQELIRRAPGTYNHSITVASLAEAAAEAIGARGLLVRVGAYFHDIGKMLKPGYFIENQGQSVNQHDSLVPAMSTLVIIAHVKDGADLARQNKLPECIIDFILQHHGTTLVEFFYRQAKQRSDEAGSDSAVDERSFRYPGPKPQTKEAGVLMLTDAVESASRTLVEPTPSRIENLVEQLTRKRLDDGQFDECGLTLEELRLIGASLIKSLTAVYHGRVKYPGQETA